MPNDDLISRAAALNALLMSKNYRDAHDALEQLHAADAVPVVHAHWIEYYTDIMCSHCHATYKDEIVDTYQDSVDHRRYVGLEYCPHCGALMSEDE